MCQSLAGFPLDTWLGELVLQALEPAAPEVRLEVTLDQLAGKLNNGQAHPKIVPCAGTRPCVRDPKAKQTFFLPGLMRGLAMLTYACAVVFRAVFFCGAFLRCFLGAAEAAAAGSSISGDARPLRA